MHFPGLLDNKRHFNPGMVLFIFLFIFYFIFLFFVLFKEPGFYDWGGQSGALTFAGVA